MGTPRLLRRYAALGLKTLAPWVSLRCTHGYYCFCRYAAGGYRFFKNALFHCGSAALWLCTFA
jgi:hypothetical protein